MLKQKRTNFLPCIFTLVTLVWLTSCENNLNTVTLITSKDKTPLDIEDTASIVYTDSAKTKFHLTAQRIENYGGNDPKLIFPKGMHIDFYDDSNHLNGQIDADYALRHENTKLMEADNNVRVVNRKGDKLNTEQLFWDAGRHKIYTNRFVTIKTAKQIIYGDGLVSNEDFTQYKITNISGTIQLDNQSEKGIK
jgi:LPS export ABC transporter protein LptC